MNWQQQLIPVYEVQNNAAPHQVEILQASLPLPTEHKEKLRTDLFKGKVFTVGLSIKK
jgi:hypothetical protein